MNRDVWWAKHKRLLDARYKREYPRSGEPWGVVEDKRLGRIVKKLSRRMRPRGYAFWSAVGNALGRTATSVQQRWQVLKAVAEHLKVERRKRV